MGKNIRSVFPEIDDVFNAILALDDNLEQIEVGDFIFTWEEVGTFRDGLLTGGLGTALLLSKGFAADQLDWLGIEKRTGIVDLKKWIVAVNCLETSYSKILCEFYNHPVIELGYMKSPNLAELKTSIRERN